jgi:hypothetical protein
MIGFDRTAALPAMKEVVREPRPRKGDLPVLLAAAAHLPLQQSEGSPHHPIVIADEDPVEDPNQWP